MVYMIYNNIIYINYMKEKIYMGRENLMIILRIRIIKTEEYWIYLILLDKNLEIQINVKGVFCFVYRKFERMMNDDE